KNFKRNKGVTISLPTAQYIKEADYFGIASSLNTKDKFERTGLHAHKASVVNAPVIEEFPLCLECEFQYVDEQGIYFFEIKKVLAEESVLDEQGNLDLAKCDGVLFDQASGRYFRIGEFLAKAFSIGMALK
ncbi:MAG: flavin oxidoreductase, partial [Bacilli bacterium]|nr:flavin oxidoreductase [Bacilli bacterium]